MSVGPGNEKRPRAQSLEASKPGPSAYGGTRSLPLTLAAGPDRAARPALPLHCCVLNQLLMELGLYTFAELTPDPVTGRSISPAERLRNLIEEATLADEVGLDVFGIGEHHRPDFAVSAPAIALAAVAERTQRIRLTSAVSVLSSDDPVRVFQQFATLDLLSGGRAEIMAGRGSFIESFPLFGYDLADYDELFPQIGCADDSTPGSTRASVTVDVAPGNPYFVQVGGFGAFSAAGGALQYTSSFSDPDPDDDGATGGDDCDETNPNRNHHLPEIKNNDVDENCDGVVLIDRDNDDSPLGTDCNDNNAAETPGKTEIPKNNLDDDCLGGDSKDGDGDGEADKRLGGKDCDDANARINTRANEKPGNWIDENCDGRNAPGRLKPAPQFDISGSAYGTGSRLNAVTALLKRRGWRVRASCRGRGCLETKTVRIRRSGNLAFRAYEGRVLGGGAVLTIGAWIPGHNVRGESTRASPSAQGTAGPCFGNLNPPGFRPGKCGKG